jgi:hypothetical protein
VIAGVGAGPAPTKPNVALAPAARAPLWSALRTVTADPEVLSTPFRSDATLEPAGIVHVAVQERLAAVPVFLIVTSPWKPPDQALVCL